MIKGVNFQLSATNNAQGAFNSFNRGLAGMQRGIGQQAPLMRSWNAGLNSNRRGVQQLGFQMTDFAVQVAGGQSAMLAFVQQGGQMLQFFGPFGAVMAAFLAVFGSLYIAMTKTGIAINQLYPFLGVLSDEFQGVVAAMQMVIDVAQQMGVWVIHNLDQIMITALVAIGYFGTMWVASMIAASASTWTLIGALTVLKTALIRTGIGAIIILVGYLIERFLTLVKGAGGFGNAMALVGDLVAQVWDRMMLKLDSVIASMMAGFKNLQASILLAMEGGLQSVVTFGDRTMAIFQGSFDAMKAVWGALPGTIGDFAFQAANGLIAGVESMLNAVVDRINNFIRGINAALAYLPEWATDGQVSIGVIDPLALGRVDNPFEGSAAAAGEAAAGAFNAAMAQTYLSPPDFGLTRMADDAKLAAEGYNEAAGMLADAAARPLTAWQALKDALTAGESAVPNLTPGTVPGTEGAGGSGGSGGSVVDAVQKQADRIKKIFEDLQSSISGSLMSGFKALASGSKSFADVAMDFLSSVANSIIDILMTPIFNSIAGSLAGGIMRGLGGLGASFEGGGFTGTGSRSGGLDGKGGFMAMVHPNETVIDHTKGQGIGGNSVTVHMTVNTPDAQSFRKSRAQVEADLARIARAGMRGN